MHASCIGFSFPPVWFWQFSFDAWTLCPVRCEIELCQPTGTHIWVIFISDFHCRMLPTVVMWQIFTCHNKQLSKIISFIFHHPFKVTHTSGLLKKLPSNCFFQDFKTHIFISESHWLKLRLDMFKKEFNQSFVSAFGFYQIISPHHNVKVKLPLLSVL